MTEFQTSVRKGYGVAAILLPTVTLPKTILKYTGIIIVSQEFNYICVLS